MTLRAGARIGGRYTLKRLLGTGGFGDVWLAFDDAGAKLALKILHAEHLADPEAVERFSREARVLERLEHPGIARQLGSWNGEGPHAFIALEYVEGSTLDALIEARARARRPFGDEEVLSLVREIAAAVIYAHDRGVAHRDLKPKNVMVDEARSPQVKVLDFGLAKLVIEPGSAETTAGRVYGSLLYLSPEQAGGKAAGTAADVFALGTILFELCTLRRAWARDERDQPLDAAVPFSPRDPLNNPLTVGMRIVGGARPRIGAFRAGVPEALEAVLEKALAADPRARFESARAFLEAVEGAFAGRGGVEPGRARRSRAVLWVAAAIAAVALAVGPRFLGGEGEGTERADRVPEDRAESDAGPLAKSGELASADRAEGDAGPLPVSRELASSDRRRSSGASSKLRAMPDAAVQRAPAGDEARDTAAPGSADTAAPAHAEIAALLDQLRTRPGDVELRVRTASAILHAAELLPEEQRWRVRSEVRRASFGGGASALASAYRALVHPEPLTP